MKLSQWAIVVACAASLTPQNSLAETDEVDAKFFVGSEAVSLYHPLATRVGSGSAWAFTPRLGARASYGIRHWLDLGLGIEFGLPTDVMAPGVNFQESVLGNLYAEYYDIALPLTATLRREQGHALSWSFSASYGVILSHWEDRYMLSTATSRPTAMGFDASAAWYPDQFMRAELALGWRPGDWFAVTVAPYATRTFRGDLHLGLGLTADFLIGVGVDSLR